MYSYRLQPALQMLFAERPPIYASCMMISGGITEQHVIIAGFLPRHCFSSDFLGWNNQTTRYNKR